MITYRYGPYNPEDENDWTLDRLMGMLSEMILKYDIELDEALKMLLNRGLPVNLFLKEGGMDDLVNSYIEQLQEQIDSILDKFSMKEAVALGLKDLKDSSKSIEKSLKKHPDLQNRLKEALKHVSIDELMRLKWDIISGAGNRELSGPMESLIKHQEEYDTLLSGSQKYTFRGSEALSKEEALTLLKNLEELENLQGVLKEALENGDLFNFNLENLARYLGPESYQEFQERREQIFEKLKQLMEDQGLVVENEETGQMDLSPRSIRKIGRIALTEIFSQMKADSVSGSHDSDETGESENLSSKTRALEFGDSISNMDISASVVNALIRNGTSRPGFNDIEVFEARGNAKSSTVVLLDMSGSMLRANRFYNAKKVVMALDSLIRSEFRDDNLTIVGFGSLARVYQSSEIPSLQPFPVTMFNPHIRLRLDLSEEQNKSKDYAPLYFTNLQRGLQLSKVLLGTGETKNKQIILITDGVPTAHFEESVLHINYPPSPADFEAALREVRSCSEDNIVVNTFLLTSDWDMNYFGEESFIQQFAKNTMGRIFFPHPQELNKMILFDFISNKKKQFNI